MESTHILIVKFGALEMERTKKVVAKVAIIGSQSRNKRNNTEKRLSSSC